MMRLLELTIGGMKGHVSRVVISGVQMGNFTLCLLRQVIGGNVIGKEKTICVRLLP